MKRTIILAAAAVGGSLLATACAHDSPPPKTEPGAVVVTQANPRNKSDQTVNLSQDIREQCGIDDSDRAPKFDFDSTQLAGNDRDVLQKVARCFSTGPLKGRSMRLIGSSRPSRRVGVQHEPRRVPRYLVRKYLAPSA